VTWVPDSEMSLLPNDHPGTLRALRRLQLDGLKPLALADLPQQCARMVDDMAAQTHLGDPRTLGYAWSSRITALRITPAGGRDAADCGLASEARS
jgi:hypothetical protein